MFRFHSKGENKTPRVTVVGVHEGDKLKIAVSRCSEHDQFARKTGRELAESRLNSGEIHTEVGLTECNIKTFLIFARAIATEVILNKKPTK